MHKDIKMSGECLNHNDLKIVIHILKRLEKRLYRLRITLCGGKEMENLKDELGKLNSNLEIDDGTELSPQMFGKEYRIVFDCCDIEVILEKILTELVEFGTFKSLFELVQEKEEVCEKFEKHEKSLNNKRQEEKELKRQLSIVSDKSDYEAAPEQDAGVSRIPQTDSSESENISYMKQLLEQKVDSKKEYYEHLFKETNENTEKFEREAQIQTHVDIQIFSVWLLKFEAQVVDLDKELRKAFDDWAMKKREIAVLKKYKKFNLEKIERVTKQISKREEVIESDNKEKEIERQKAEEERRKYIAATLIQAHWRGTMVRKHLGPFKLPKKKKGKKKIKK